jgi:ATP-dependent protease HslVU (ClpYQ) peptidase subunit
MAFTTEADVRNHLGGIGTDVVSSDAIDQAIDEAHEDLSRDLKEEYAGSTDAVLAQAEMELATAYLLRSLASREALEENEIDSPMLRVGSGKKFAHLTARAEYEECIARGRLAPFLVSPPERFCFEMTGGESE